MHVWRSSQPSSISSSTARAYALGPGASATGAVCDDLCNAFPVPLQTILSAAGARSQHDTAAPDPWVGSGAPVFAAANSSQRSGQPRSEHPARRRPLALYSRRRRASRTAAMRLLQAGVDTTVIALWLGHENVETTQIYLHVDLELKE